LEQRAQKSFGSFAKRTGDGLPFYNLGGCWIKQIMLFYSNESEGATVRFSFFSFEKETKPGTSQPKVSLSMKN